MKISFITHGKIGGLGQGYISGQIAASLKKGGWSQLFASGFSPEGTWDALERVTVSSWDEFSFGKGLLAKALSRTGLTYAPTNAWMDWQVSRKLKPCDCLHAFASQSFLSIQRAKKFGAKIIADNPNTHPRHLRQVLRKEYQIWKVPFEPYHPWALERRMQSLESADRVLVLSENSRKTFLAYGFPEDALCVVPYGVDLDLFQPVSESEEPEKFRVLFMGQVCLRKGFQYLLEAWKRLRFKDAELVFAGSLKADARYAFEKFSDVPVTLLGPLPDMSAIAREYQKASVAVFPSVEEGFGMVVTEAMASGLPVIVSESVGAKDFVEHGIQGFVVPDRDAKAIAERILELYEDKAKRKNMGVLARKKMETNPWDRYHEDLCKVYEEMKVMSRDPVTVPPKRVMVFGHMYTEPIHRKKFRFLNDSGRFDLTIVSPGLWKHDLGPLYFKPVREGENFRLLRLPIQRSGSYFRFTYENAWFWLEKYRPRIVEIDQEPASRACYDLIRFINKSLPNTKIIVWTSENTVTNRSYPMSAYEKYNLARIDHVIAGNQDAVKLLRKKGYQGPISQFQFLGVDPELFFKKDASWVREKYQLGNFFTVGYVGRLSKVKGLPTLLKAFSHLSRDARLLVVGTGEMEAELQSYSRSLGIQERVVWTGTVPHESVPDLMNAMDVLVLPSEGTRDSREKFGYVLPQAMCCQVPVIGTRHGGIPDVIGDAGLLYEPGKVEALAEILTRLKVHPEERQKWAQKGYQRALENFTVETVARKIAKIYDRLG